MLKQVSKIKLPSWVLAASVILMTFFWIYFHSSVVEKSLTLSQTNEKIASLYEQNVDLEKTIAVKSSLRAIQERTQALGLAVTESIVALKDTGHYAMR